MIDSVCIRCGTPLLLTSKAVPAGDICVHCIGVGLTPIEQEELRRLLRTLSRSMGRRLPDKIQRRLDHLLAAREQERKRQHERKAQSLR